MRLPALLLVALAAATAACGAPSELSDDDGAQLALARDRVLAAAKTERELAESPQSAERLLARVRRIVASGAFEARQLDEFGLAALGELRLSAPSLVIVDRREIPRQLDRPALTAFLAHATTDPPAALRPTVATEVDRAIQILDEADAGPDTRIPVADMPTDLYLSDLIAHTQDPWPAIAAKLAQARSSL